jgi:hypothetical protein
MNEVWEQEKEKGIVEACMHEQEQEDRCVFARSEVYRLGG